MKMEKEWFSKEIVLKGRKIEVRRRNMNWMKKILKLNEKKVQRMLFKKIKKHKLVKEIESNENWIINRKWYKWKKKLKNINII